MKKVGFICFFIVFGFCTIYSQQWSSILNGNFYNLNSGNVGIGTNGSVPLSKLDVRGEIRSTLLTGVASNIRMIYGEYASMLRNDGNDTYLLFTNNNDINGSFNTLRPFRVNNATGDVYFADGKIQIKHSNGIFSTNSDISLNNNRKLGIVLNDVFNYNAKVMGHYSLGWFDDNWNSSGSTLWMSGYGGIKFFTAGSPKLSIDINGKVGIGTTQPNYKLDVNGTIHAKEIIVDMIGWSDFVFNKDYKLSPLNEVYNFIQNNGHLPNIPSEKDVKDNGVNVVEMQAKLLQKIEELTLYVIEQDNKIKNMEIQLKQQIK